ncbi:MAG: class I SAM-dependent methyltransferase [Alphaproteobacteria bacterium]|nr:class I SAM-dependent methyltransferase [Alphaproteobacteria bacterium]
MPFGYFPPRSWATVRSNWRHELRYGVLGQDNLIKRAHVAQTFEFLDLDADLEVLEVGAGGLYYAGEIARKVKRMVALERIDRFHEWLFSRRHSGTLAAVRGDAQALPFADSSFDLVFLSEVIPVLPDPLACLNDIARVLRPGGRVVIVNGKWWGEMEGLFRSPLLRRLIDASHRKWGTPRTYEAFLARHREVHGTQGAYFQNTEGFVLDLVQRAGLVVERKEWGVGPSAERLICFLLLVNMWLTGKLVLGGGQSLWLPVLKLLDLGASKSKGLTLFVSARKRAT